MRAPPSVSIGCSRIKGCSSTGWYLPTAVGQGHETMVAFARRGRPRTEVIVHDDVPKPLTPIALSELLSIPIQTLYRWHSRGEGPKARRIGRHLRYDPADVKQWLDERTKPSSRESDGTSTVPMTNRPDVTG